jgi:uncharacterized protein
VEARLVEFAEVLRQNGLKVAVSEVNDATSASAAVGLEDRAMFRAALKATLCKRQTDVPTFDRAFDFYFGLASRAFEGIDKSLADRIREEGLLEGDELQMLLYTLNQLGPGLNPLTQAALEQDPGRLAQLLRGAALQLDLRRIQSPLQSGFFSRRLMQGAGGEAMRADLRALEEELQRRGMTADGLEIVSRQVSAVLREVEEAARREITRQVAARLKRPEGGSADRAFHTLSRQEIDATGRAVRRLAEKLKTRLVRKQKSRRKGALNPIRTLRKNLTSGGVPMVPVFRHRRPARPDVVVLCDVSDSVRNASRMMLLFMHTLQSLFARVRSFVFVSDLGEITKHFEEAKPEDAIDLALSSKVISLASNSNYGHALATFTRGHLGSITRRTTVLVIGDGRNNYNAANAWALADLKRKARRVVWICTEPKANWGFGDSEMLRYSRAVHQTVIVQSLADLERVAEDLVPNP